MHTSYDRRPGSQWLSVRVQVGSYAVERASWGRPEDVTVGRPYYTNLAGSSDLAGSVVAALAAASCALNKTDGALAASLLAAATVGCRLCPCGPNLSHERRAHQIMGRKELHRSISVNHVGNCMDECSFWHPHPGKVVVTATEHGNMEIEKSGEWKSMGWACNSAC